MNDGKNVIVSSIGEFAIERITNDYIVNGASAEDLSKKYLIPVENVQSIIENNQLDKLRAAHIKHGLAALQNVQLVQAEKLMTIENQFKRIRIIQLEKSLEDYMAYYSKYGHFYKVHPITDEVLKDSYGIPMQIKIPNVAHEIAQLKESVTFSEGLKVLLDQIDDIINKPKAVKTVDSEVMDMDNFNGLFQKKKPEDD